MNSSYVCTVKRRLIQWIRREIDTEYVSVQEFYAFCGFTVLVTAVVVVLMSDRLVVAKELDQRLARRQQADSVLSMSTDSVQRWIAENAICQWLSLHSPNEETIRAIECRYDSASVLYHRLIQLGWKFDSIDAFLAKHLPQDWRSRLENNRIWRGQGLMELQLRSDELTQATLQNEAINIQRVRLLKVVFAGALLLLFPLRWMYLYGYCKKGRFNPFVHRTSSIGH